VLMVIDRMGFRNSSDGARHVALKYEASR